MQSIISNHTDFSKYSLGPESGLDSMQTNCRQENVNTPLIKIYSLIFSLNSLKAALLPKLKLPNRLSPVTVCGRLSLCVRVAMLRAVPGVLTGLFALFRQVIALPAGGKGAASEPGSIEAKPCKQQLPVGHKLTVF